jgi:hypothetical protein
LVSSVWQTLLAAAQLFDKTYNPVNFLETQCLVSGNARRVFDFRITG